MNLKDRIININPDKINLYSEPPNWWWFNPINKKISNILIKKYLKYIAIGRMYYVGNWDLNSYKFNETSWYLKIKNLKDNLSRPELSYWYQTIINEINLKGYYFHKEIKITNHKQAKFFFENYIFNLIDSLKKKNYIIQNKNDIPTALLGRNGELIKSGNGCHRLAIIKNFNIQCKYPIRIMGIHKKFFSNKNRNLRSNEEICNFVIDKYSK